MLDISLIPFGRGRLLQALGGAPPLKPAPGAPVFVEPDALRSSVFELPDIVPSPPEPLYDHPVPIPPYNWPPRLSSVAASKELSHELDKDAMRSLVHAENSVFLTDMNLALSNQCKQFRVETEQKGRELTSVKQKLERTNQRLKQATAPGIAPSAPDAEEARLPLGRGQLNNMMLERANQRLIQATAPEAHMFDWP